MPIGVIEILGPGCSRCMETFRIVTEVIKEAGLSCAVLKVEDINRMVALGLTSTPGVAVDGTVVISGRIPKADEVRKALGLV